jgi:hypothetical protein
MQTKIFQFYAGSVRKIGRCLQLQQEVLPYSDNCNPFTKNLLGISECIILCLQVDFPQEAGGCEAAKHASWPPGQGVPQPLCNRPRGFKIVFTLVKQAIILSKIHHT